MEQPTDRSLSPGSDRETPIAIRIHELRSAAAADVSRPRQVEFSHHAL